MSRRIFLQDGVRALRDFVSIVEATACDNKTLGNTLNKAYSPFTLLKLCSPNASRSTRPLSSSASFSSVPNALEGRHAIHSSGETLEEVRSRIFGTHIGNGLRSGRKVLRGKLLGPVFAAYYPGDPSKADPFMPDLAAERAKLKLDRLRRRGKAPPKKGAGKRASKK